jgi:putative Holliday junction resolvase
MTLRAMSLDIGTRRIGVALSDSSYIIATPYKTLHRTHLSADIETLVSWIQLENVDRLIVGWPLESSGRVGRMAKKVESLVDSISEHIEIPVFLWDERMTSVIAERALLAAGTRRKERKQLIDKVAAAVILQGWLDAQKHEQNNLHD